ncbi:hypothetical protein BofuT4_uP141650.1 [Botrytis cinerea T4]|uniref:Uncharacterized protein n=1 Tax=Botryotinia fuckeliana (strain T4) TaxID=999810 RepID=G2YZ55_BOTF4|nr:hypothetical protein BofuT4_uP141650.1 [Botrytis cinerea T4]
MRCIIHIKSKNAYFHILILFSAGLADRSVPYWPR